jgi:glycosyltransferase involved in cell wall biosynthesis
VRILDIGAHDGYISRWLADQFPDATIDGLELHPPAVAAFNRRMQGRGVCRQGSAQDAPVLFDPESYDAVVLFEVIEHVPDVDELLQACEAMVRPGGLVFVSTPDGTFGAGRNHQHLRALRAVDLADILRRRGRLVDMQVHAGVTVASYRPQPRLTTRLLPDIAIYTGPGLPWSPLDIEHKGLGGSETAAVRLAEKLSEIGWVVTVYGETEDCCWRDVIFRHWRVFDPMEPRQAVIASRMPEILDRPIRARHKLLWLHDTDCDDRLTPKRAEQLDYVLTLSRWHTRHVARKYPFIRHKLVQTRNGLSHDYFDGEQPERAQRVVFTSSPDRGLDVLLELWPRIRKKAPNAELAFACSPFYDQVADVNPYIAEHRARIRELEQQPGVERLGHLTQPEVAQLLRSSMVWAHPSWSTPTDAPFHETSCIAAMEAQAAGCVAVASNWGALSETVRIGRLIDGPAKKKWRDAFVRELVDALTNPETQTWAQAEGPRAVAELGWQGVAVHVAGLVRD